MSEDLRGIAIIGLAGRFPGARDAAELWRNLREGVESITFFSPEELRAAGVDPAEIARPGYVPARALLDGIEEFDADFFGFTPREAELTDPQQRLFLEHAWTALENAGYDPRRYPGPIGVFGGAGLNAYLLLHLWPRINMGDVAGSLQASIHNKNDHLTTRVAYELGLRGPAVSVQTACSTSLVATALACQSLLHYQCDMALAGGVTVTLPQRAGYTYQEGGIASPDGHCRAFDARAQGTVDGSGVGLVVLKRLEDAVADGDTILAVIKGAALNNDGAGRAGYTAPGLDSQAEVIATAHALAGVEAGSIAYVEAHGTGTPLGDPIEIAALTQAFRLTTDRRNFCAVGSIKTNFGHLDAAAGVAGLIKTTLALRHREIPPSLHFEKPNPGIDFASSPFFVNATLRDWPAGPEPRRAGVSSFGIGGTNAHLVLEEAPELPAADPEPGWQLLVLSARTGSALEAATDNLARHLREAPEAELAALSDVAWTLQEGRAVFEHRRAVLAESAADAVAALESLDPERVFQRVQPAGHRPVSFLFPGQGAQYAGMGAGLYEAEPVYRREVDRALGLLPRDLAAELRPLLTAPDGDTEVLARTDLAQPALFVVEHALAKLWMEWGVRPQSFLGHSLGEYVAACLAGVMTLEEALALVAARGRLVASLPGGAMLSVSLPEAELLPRLGSLSLAAVNGPSLCVASGPDAAIDELERSLSAEGIVCRRLHTSHAFHSEVLDPILDTFEAEVRKVKLSAPAIPFLSNLTGTWITEAEATTPGYWVRHLRHTVRFADGVRELLHEPRAVLLEVGPGRTLKTAARWHTAKGPQHVVETSMRHPRETWADPAFLLGTAGRLWLAGVELDWKALHGGRKRRRVPLPTYPFERRRYWIEAPKGGRTAAPATGSLERKPDLGDWFYQPVWRESPAPLAASGGGSWLLLAQPGGAAERLAGHLSRQGSRVLRAAPGDDLAARLAELAEAGPVRGIVHAWCAERDAGDAGDGQALDLGFHGLLGLARTLADHPAAAEGLDVVALTGGLQPVTGAEELRPERAVLLGPVKVIPREDPRLRCRSLDVSWTGVPPGSPREERILGRLAAEIASSASEVAVAYRGERRWVQDYAPVHLPGTGEPPLRLREGGVYLVTGGLGGVGLEIAELLAREARARLVLTGRSAFPERGAWPAWLAGHGEGDSTSRRIRRLERLESLGAAVWTAAADVTDRDAVTRLVAEIRERYGAIHGAIHAAGVPDGGLIQLRTREASDAVLAAKVTGTRNLAEAVAGPDLDFLALFSSLSGVVGRLGQVAYGAANAFLDAFAHDHTARTGVLTLSIDWGEWQGVGMAADPEKDSKDDKDSKDGRPAGSGVLDVLEVLAVLPAGPHPSAPAHPFLETRRAGPSPGEVIFATPFSIERHWVLDEHRLMGHAVIPGVAYYEMVRAALADQATGNALRFSDVLFIAPIHVRDNDPREVRLHLIPEGESSWRFAVRSQTDAEYLGGEVGLGDMDFVTGRVAWVDAPRPPRRDLDEIRRRCDLRRAVWTEEDREDDLGPRWQNVKFADVGRSEVLTRLELGSEHAADFQIMKLHPSLLDRSAGVAKEYLVEGTYLPLAYGRLTVYAELPPRIYSHARYREDPTSNFETLTFDTSVLDDAGDVIVEIENFSQKRVNDAAVKIREASGGAGEARPATARPAQEDRARQEMQPAEGAEAFRRLLAWAPGPQVAVSVRDLHAVLAQADRMGHERILEETGKHREARPAHPRPRLSTAYAAPRNDAEKAVAAAWADMLGLDQVGVHDNFFELGGDSVQALQIIASLRAAGLELTPQQFFQHQTVAELVAHATPGAKGATAAEAAPLPALAPDELRRLGLPEEEIEDSYPLSPLQQGMLFHTLYAPGSGDYVEQVWWILEGDLDEPAFAAAWREVVARQPVLRTAFAWEDLPEPFQAVWRHAELPVRRLDWRREWAGLSPEERDARDARLVAWLQDDRRAGFDPSRPPLARLTELRLSDNERRYVWTYHHALMDGWSAPLVLAEVSQIYEARVGGKEPRLDEVRPYRSFIAWLRAQDRAAAEAFWRREMAGFEPAEPLAVPAGGAGAEGALSTERARLPAEAADRLRHLARRHQVTLNTLVQGAWALLLSRHGAGDDVVFGGVVAGRPTDLPGVERWVGLFINTLPVRVRVPDTAEPAAWLRDLQSRQLAARGFEHTALADIRDWAGLPLDRPLFESILVFENLPDTGGPGEGDTSGRLALRDVARAPGRTGFPLTVEVFPGADLTVDVTGDGRFAPEAVSRMSRHFLRLLEALADTTGTGRRLDSLSPLSEAERRQLLAGWNPATAFPWTGPVHRAFEAWSARRPDATAVSCGGEEVSYGELNRRAEESAQRLRAMGVGPETVVALLIPPSVDLIVAILAVWKAGGAYQPLDPESPPERWAWLLADGGSHVLLTTGDLAQRLPELPETGELNVIHVDGRAGAPSPAQRGRVGEGAVGPGTLAYLLYTSGSTGRPKGVEVTHGNVARLFESTRAIGFDDTDTWTLFHSAAFDFSVWEVWGALAHGGRLVVVPPGVSRDTEAFRSLLARERVTVLSQTPSAFQALTRIEEAAASNPLPLKAVVFGGEALDPASLRPWLDRRGETGPRFWNLYGITETTVHVTLHEVTMSEAAETRTAGGSPIGLPLPDLQVHLLGSSGHLVPVGVPGEIHVGGAGLARGYRGRPDLTAERFVPDPFSPVPGSRLYRSGDLARRLADGALEYLGRIDHQVKIRGYRIEPAEIEAALVRHPEVRAAAVEASEAPGAAGDRRLVAFVVPQNGEIATDALRGYLAGELPPYMVPSAFVTLAGLPLTANGKLDRRALARLAAEGGRPASETLYVPPRTPAEEEIAALWTEILGVEKAGSRDNFFDLGGHSLLAARAAGRLRAAFHVEVPVRVIFDRPVLADLAAWVEQTLAEQAGGDELEALLAELEGLPEQEAEPRRG